MLLGGREPWTLHHKGEARSFVLWEVELRQQSPELKFIYLTEILISGVLISLICLRPANSLVSKSRKALIIAYNMNIILFRYMIHKLYLDVFFMVVDAKMYCKFTSLIF